MVEGKRQTQRQHLRESIVSNDARHPIIHASANTTSPPPRLYLTTRTAKATLLPIPQQDPPSAVTFETSLATTRTTAVSTRPYATHRRIKHVLHIRQEHSLFTIILRSRYTRPDRALLPHSQTCHATGTDASPHFCTISFNLWKPTLMIIS